MSRTLSQRHERELAEVLPSGSQVVASGAKFDKHDVRTMQTATNKFWRFRYEAKCTQKKSYSLKLQDWKDLEEYVYSCGADERPAWAVRYYESDTLASNADVPVRADLVIVDLNDWVELLSELERLREQDD